MTTTPAITSFSGPYRFLSNFYWSKVSYDFVTYSSVEHAFQAAKTFDLRARQRIAEAESFSAAKSLGRTVPMRPDWDTVKFDIMRGLLKQKFAQPWLRAMLDQTKGYDLVEGNTWGDRIWGQDPVGVGENWLGRLLMEIRDKA